MCVVKNDAILPNAHEAIIPMEKLTNYALNPIKSRGKWVAFQDALGYNLHNAHLLAENIKQNLEFFPAVSRGDKGYGCTYTVLMELIGENGKSANVMTAWIKDNLTNKVRLTSVYVKKRRVCNND
jgi:hypothetical protein